MAFVPNQCFFSGTSGLVLPVPNKHAFPDSFKDKSRLTYYASLFNSIEVNSSFYKVPRPATVAGWAQEVPAGFRFTFKLFRGITHNKLLAFEEASIEPFMQTINKIGDKKGALLIQLPKSTTINLVQLKRLLSSIACYGTGWQLSMEFRDKSWYHAEVYAILKDFNAAIVVHDMPGSAPPVLEQWASHAYLRYHGEKGDYRGSYTKDFLREQARVVRENLLGHKTVYAYFNNTIGDAVKNVTLLNEMVDNLYLTQ